MIPTVPSQHTWERCRSCYRPWDKCLSEWSDKHPPSSKYWKKPNAQSECFTCVHRLITEECNHTTDWLWGRLDWFKDTLISKKRNLLQLKGDREREREVETYRAEARQKDSNATTLRLSGCHWENAKCTEQWSDVTASTSGREGTGKTVGKLSVSQLYSSSDQLWCWWTFFLLQSPHLQASLHPKTPHPKLRPVLCPVHLWHYCTTLPSHYPVRWNLKTLSDALQSHSFLAAFPGPICGFSTAFFLLFLPDTSPPCPKKKRLALHSCFPVFFL